MRGSSRWRKRDPWAPAQLQWQSIATGVSYHDPSDLLALHGKTIGDQWSCYRATQTLQPSSTVDRYLTRPQSPVSISQGDPQDYVSSLMVEDGSQQALPPHMPPSSQPVLMPEMLDLKLQALAQQLTRGITQDLGKISRKRRGEIDLLGECTATLKSLEVWWDFALCSGSRRGECLP